MASIFSFPTVQKATVRDEMAGHMRILRLLFEIQHMRYDMSKRNETLLRQREKINAFMVEFEDMQPWLNTLGKLHQLLQKEGIVLNSIENRTLLVCLWNDLEKEVDLYLKTRLHQHTSHVQSIETTHYQGRIR